MKKNFISLMIAMMAIALFSTCSKSSDSSDDDDGGGSSSGDELVINAQDIENNDSYIATVKAVTDDGDLLATATYNNAGFKLTIKAPASKYLYSPDEVYEGADISNSKAKMVDVAIEAYDRNGEYVGDIFMTGKNYSDIFANFVYADRDFTVKGKSDQGYKYDCSFKKGWNIVYETTDDHTYSYSTKKPSGVNIVWTFRDKEEEHKFRK